MKKLIAPYGHHRETVHAALRIVTGLLMAYHGWELFDSKMLGEYAAWSPIASLPNPILMVGIGKAIELVGGVLLAVGLLTRVAALFLIFTMLYITFWIGKGRVWYEEQHPFLFLLLGAFFLFSGGGRWSLDRLWHERLGETSGASRQ